MRWFVTLGLVPLWGCSAGRTVMFNSGAFGDVRGKLRVVQVDSPAAAGSAEPNLALGDDGRLYLSWIESLGESGHALRFSVWTGSGWSSSKTIATGGNWFVNWADFPSLAVLEDGTMAAHWLAKSSAGTFSYDVRISISGDGGKSWSRSFTPHRDGTPTEHGFVSMVPLDSGRFGLFWLDGREMSGGHGHGQGDMALRFATLTADGSLGAERVVDDRVCECCQTSAVCTDNGDVIVVYRDRSADEVSDIGLVRLSGNRFSDPTIMHADHWKIPGCPVNGPSIAAGKETVAVVWFTMGTDGKGRVRLAVSGDGGRVFGAPIAIDDGRPLGRVDVAILADDSVLVCWLEKAKDDSEIRLRRVRTDGFVWPAVTVAETRRNRSSGFPQLGRVGDQVVLAWTDGEEPSRVLTAVVGKKGRRD